jgi:hypothetical protein
MCTVHDPGPEANDLKSRFRTYDVRVRNTSYIVPVPVMNLIKSVNNKNVLEYFCLVV